MKASTFLNIVKNISFFILAGISFSLTTYLFTQFSEHLIEKILFGMLAFAVEGSKIYSLVSGFNLLGLKKYAGFAIRFTIYILLALLSILASYGFSLSSIQGTTNIVEVSDFEMEQNKKDITSIDRELETLLKKQEDTPFEWVGLHKQLRDKIDQLRKQKAELTSKIITKPVTKAVAKDVFQLIGETIGLTGKQVMFALLMLLSIMIETCIVFTSPRIIHGPSPTKTKERKINKRPKTPLVYKEENVKIEPISIPVVEKESPKKIEPIAELEPNFVVEPEPELEPVKKPMRFGGNTKKDKELFEKFLLALFNSNDNKLKDIKSAANEAGLDNETAALWFKKLVATRGNKGYPLVEFRNKSYYRYYAVEYILKKMTETT